MRLERIERDVCGWCGHRHDARALCARRPRWSRRGFLAFVGAAAIGVAVDPVRMIAPAIVENPWLVANREYQLVLATESLLRDCAVDVESLFARLHLDEWVRS